MMGTALDTELRPSNRKGRANYLVEFKRRLASAACEAGVSVSKLAMANGVNANMVCKWRREFRAGLFEEVTHTMPKLMPVEVGELPAQVVVTTPAAIAVSAVSEPIEIVSSDAVVRVCDGASPDLLRTIFARMCPSS
jgi:transposase